MAWLDSSSCLRSLLWFIQLANLGAGLSWGCWLKGSVSLPRALGFLMAWWSRDTFPKRSIARVWKQKPQGFLKPGLWSYSATSAMCVWRKANIFNKSWSKSPGQPRFRREKTDSTCWDSYKYHCKRHARWAILLQPSLEIICPICSSPSFLSFFSLNL